MRTNYSLHLTDIFYVLARMLVHSLWIPNSKEKPHPPPFCPRGKGGGDGDQLYSSKLAVDRAPLIYLTCPENKYLSVSPSHQMYGARPLTRWRRQKNPIFLWSPWRAHHCLVVAWHRTLPGLAKACFLSSIRGSNHCEPMNRIPSMMSCSWNNCFRGRVELYLYECLISARMSN